MRPRTGVDKRSSASGHSRKPRIIAAAATLVVALAAVVWFVRRGPVVARVQLDCVPGQAHRFAIEYVSRGELLDSMLGIGPAAGEGQTVDISVRGHATETCMENGPGGQVFALELAELAGEANVLPSPRQPVSELLAGTSFVEIERDGFVRSIRFADGMPPLGQNIVRDLLSHRSMRLAASATGAWRTEEVSVDGTYTADYQIDATSETGTRLRKRRATHAASADRPHARYLEGSVATIAIERAWLDQLDSTTDVEVMSGKKVVGKSRTHVVLRGTAVEPRSTAPLRALLARARASRARLADLAASDVDGRLDEKIQRDELGTDTWETLWAKLRDGSSTETKMFLKIRALLRLQPERCKDAAAALAGIESYQDKSFMILSNALASTGTPAAQAALRDAIAGSASKHNNQDILVAELGNLDNPDRASETLARELAANSSNDETRNVAELALGNMAAALASSEPDRAEALVSEVLQRAQAATTMDDRMVSIYNLGNTGSPRSLDLLRAATADPDFRVRKAAAAALRSLVGSDVEQILLALAVGDPEQSVRAEAATSLHQRSVAPVTFDALAQLVRRDPAEQVRQTLVAVLAGFAEQYPAAIEVIEWVAQHDPKTDVRNNAQLALVQLRNA